MVGDGGGEATPAALQAVFDFARNRRLLPPNVDETSVLDGSPPDVLALVFAVFLMGAKRLFNVADEAALAERLLAFAKAATEPHADVNVQDLTVSWGDGRALLALVSAVFWVARRLGCMGESGEDKGRKQQFERLGSFNTHNDL